MLTSTHRCIARWAYARLSIQEKALLPRWAFVVGNLLPDLKPKPAGKRHVYSDMRLPVGETLDMLLKRPGGRWASALALGGACHHVADAFCRYHHDPMAYPERRRHFLYECRMAMRWDRVLRRGGEARASGACHGGPVTFDGLPDAAALLAYLESQLEAYGWLMPDPQTDIAYAAANVLFIVRSVMAGRAYRVAQRERWLYGQHAPAHMPG